MSCFFLLGFATLCIDCLDIDGFNGADIDVIHACKADLRPILQNCSTPINVWECCSLII